jgi:cell wall-associated NlpC family hydrolase
MSANELERSAELIERLLGEPELRRRFRTDAAGVLVEAGLPHLAAGLGHGERALMTLELRESRSSLAGVMVAAAAEGVDFAHLAEHAAPDLAHDIGRDVDRLMDQPHHHAPAPVHHDVPASVKPATARPEFSAVQRTPRLVPAPAPVHPAATPAPAPAPSDPAAASAPAPASGTQATAGAAPDAQAQMSFSNAQPTGKAAEHAAASAHHDHAGSGPEAELTTPSSDSVLAYPGDNATPQQLAAWMGAHAQRAGLPPELPLMASLTESGLRNLSYGDRDSVGFFQMRLGIWDEGPYAGYPDHPELQIQWFIDHALAARQEDPALASSPSTWGEWVANVEMPAEQYRYRYQLQLSTAQELLRGADLAPAAGSVTPVSAGQAALDAAMKLAHGAGDGHGPDPAALVQYAYARQGIQLPRVAAQQYDLGVPIARHDLRPGDAVFFAEPNGLVAHVGLYAGHDRIVSSSPTGVTVSSLTDAVSAGRFVGARRYTASSLGDPASYARPLPTVQG